MTPDVEAIADLPGRFGPLSVVDTLGARSLNCGLACHGAGWLEPTLTIAGEIYRPGPVPESDYILGWLLPVVRNPFGHVLMAGLGSGMGPIALAYAFPRLRITVAEIDPAVITLARGHFPLLRHYEREGRIAVRCEDIAETAARAPERGWSIAFLDAYQESSHLHCPGDLLRGLRGRARELWLNVLDDERLGRTEIVAGQLIACSWDPRCAIPIQDGVDGIGSSNVLLGTAELPLEQLEEFAPFAALDHAHAQRAQNTIAQLVAGARPWRYDRHRRRRDGDPDR